MGPRRGWVVRIACATLLALVSTPPSVGAAGTELIVDGGFEAGPLGGAWTESSDAYGTPVCEETFFCVEQPGSGPRTGDHWAWFGGTASETAVVAQDVTIPAGEALLSFWIEVPECSDLSPGTFSAEIDGAPVFTTDDDDPACGVLGYTAKAMDLSDYADGGIHNIAFTGTFPPGADDEWTSFYLDDVSLADVVATTTSLTVRKTTAKLKAKGTVSPAQSGSVDVTLLRKRRGAFRPVKTVAVTLDPGGAFAAAFNRPRSGRCMVQVAFPGDDDSGPSSASRTLRC